MYTSLFSISLTILGLLGSALFVTLTLVILQRYSPSPIGSFRWQMRSFHLKRLAAVASLFFLAIAASYALIQEVWGLLFLFIAFKTGSWWFRLALEQRS